MTAATKAAAALSMLALALIAAPAQAKLEEVKVGSETLKFGVITRQPPTVTATPLSYHNGPVDSASYIYAIYWDPSREYHPEWLRGINGFLHDIAQGSGQLSSVFSLDGQYTGQKFATRANYAFTFRGAYSDVFPYPTTERCNEPKGRSICLTDAQIRAELRRFIANEHLPTGREVTYYLFTPPSVTVCLDEGEKGNCSTGATEIEEEKNETGLFTSPSVATGICGYHAAIEPASSSPIVYGVQPWVSGHAGQVLVTSEFETLLPNGAALACQGSENLVEPNQLGSFPSTDSYEAGLSDVIVGVLAREQSNIATNPLLSAWYQEGTNAEQSDICRGVYSVPSETKPPTPPNTTHALSESNQTYGGHSYYLQWAFSSIGALNKKIECWSGTELDPHFTATTLVNNGDDVAFDALESSSTFNADPSEIGLEPFTPTTYKWEFGDGTSAGPAVQASILHSYQYAGQYQVTLTVTDNTGNTDSFSQTIPVTGAPRPTTPATPGVIPGSGATPAPAAAGSGSRGGGATPAGTAPTVVQSVLSRSLSKAVNLGLAVHYNVNEQVAGRVEALLAGSTAAKLGIKARAVSGLPAGYPRSVLVGSAVLVTTKGGQGTVRIRFAPAMARKLAKAHRLSLTLRSVMHNASRPPRTTTQLSTVVLSK